MNSISDFNESLFRLYYDFLKANKLFGYLYTNKPNLVPTLSDSRIRRWPMAVSGFSNVCTYSILPKGPEIYKNCHVISQLWRGYVLDNFEKLKFLSEHQKLGIKYELFSDLKINGTRGDKRIKDILVKYNIKVNETV